jgi:cytochrome c553
MSQGEFCAGMREKEMNTKKNQPYPAAWDEDRVRKLAEHYDNQTEGEQVAEHEAAYLAEGQTVMVVPTELVPEIVKLLSEKRPA